MITMEQAAAELLLTIILVMAAGMTIGGLIAWLLSLAGIPAPRRTPFQGKGR